MKKKFIAGILFAASLSLGAGAWRQSARADDQNGYNADIPQMEGQSIDHITMVTGMREGTVKSHLSRGKKKMADYLRHNGYDRQ